MEVDISLPAIRVIRSLEQIIECRGKPTSVRCDCRPEYISGVLQAWAHKQEIALLYIQPGNPQQNAYIERYNRAVRYAWLGLAWLGLAWLGLACLASNLFNDIEQVQEIATR